MENPINISAIKTELEKFQRKLNEEPPKNEIQVNEAAGGSIYLPISFVQMKLDELYYGLWESEITHVQVVANEIIGYGYLEVTHPVTGTKIRRAGAGAVMVQMKSEKAGGNGRISDVENKIKNTLVKDFPHLKAEIEKSAAKTLGKIFGRDLNRKHVDQYNPYSIEGESSDEIRRHLQGILDVGALPSALHTFIEANIATANHTQLCQMKGKADAEAQKLIDAPAA